MSLYQRGHVSARGSVGVDTRPSSQSIATTNGNGRTDTKSLSTNVSSSGTSIPSMIRAVSSPVSRVEYKARAAAISPTPLVPLQPIVAQEMPFLPPVTRQLSRDPYHTYLAELLAMGIDLEKVFIRHPILSMMQDLSPLLITSHVCYVLCM